jgi:hypothetical protein
VDAADQRIDCWPIHEPGWQREILRTSFHPKDESFQPDA